MNPSSIYDAQPVRPWQTRLLRVEPRTGADENTIVAELIVVDITSLDGAVLHDAQQHVQFRALSYTWGAEPFSKTISLDEQPYAVKPNLYDFLQQYCTSTESNGIDYIWIDALCIDQSNPNEKAVQVAKILPIFEKSIEVIVWLGTEAKHTGVAIDAIRDDQTRSIDDLDDIALEGLEDLCNREWYRRVWIKQEIYAARSIHVWCGRHQIPWAQLIRGAGLLSPTPSALRNSPASRSLRILQNLEQRSTPEATKFVYDCASGNSCEDAVSAIQGDAVGRERFGIPGTVSLTQPKEILRLIAESTECESTDLRDRIYALLGMSTDQSFPISYTATAGEVFTLLARYAVFREGTISFLFEANASFGASQDLPDLPSWVPDWRTFRSSDIFSGMNLDFLQRHLAYTMPHWLDLPRDERWSIEALIFDITQKSIKLRHNLFDDRNSRNLCLHGIRILEQANSGTSCFRQLMDRSTIIAMEMLDLLIQVMSERLIRNDFNEVLDLHLTTALSVVTADKSKVIEKLSVSQEMPYSEGHPETLVEYLKDIKLVEAESQPGDILTLCFGCRYPILLRPAYQSDCFSLVKPVRQGRKDVWSTMLGKSGQLEDFVAALHLLLILQMYNSQAELFKVV